MYMYHSFFFFFNTNCNWFLFLQVHVLRPTSTTDGPSVWRRGLTCIASPYRQSSDLRCCLSFPIQRVLWVEGLFVLTSVASPYRQFSELRWCLTKYLCSSLSLTVVSRVWAVSSRAPVVRTRWLVVLVSLLLVSSSSLCVVSNKLLIWKYWQKGSDPKS